MALFLAVCLASTASFAQVAGLQRLDDLARARIGFILGTLHGAYVEAHYPGAAAQAFNTTPDMIAALRGGKVDTALCDKISARPILAAYPELAVLDDGFLNYPLGIGFGRQRDELRARFDRWLAAARSDGRYAEMQKRWFEGDPEAVVMPEWRAKRVTERYVLGVSVADLPYVAYKDGRYVGFDIELLQRFAADAGIALEIRSLDFGALIPALAAGKVDIISDGIAITEERKKAVAFSAPYAEGGAVALVLKSRVAAAPAVAAAPSADGWRRMDDLAEGRIGVFTGTAQDMYLTRHYPKARIQRFNSQADFVLALKTGKVDVIATDSTTIEGIAQANPELAILDRDFFNTPIAAAFRLEDGALRQRFDRWLAAARADGTLAAMEKRWLSGPTDASAMPVLPRPSQGTPLKVGTSLLVGMPFVSLADGEFVGFDMELTRRFAADAGFQLEIVPLEFDSLIASLAVGKIDMIVSSLSDTEERRRRVAFSQPYLYEYSAALVLKANLAGAATTSSPATGEDGTGGLWAALQASLHANFIVEQRWKLIRDGLGVTVVISIFSTLLGTLLGGVVCWLRMSRRGLPQAIGRGYIGLVRGLPVLILLMLIYYVVFAAVDIDPLIVAVVAFGMNFAAYVSEMFRSGIESVERGQNEAGIAMGFTAFQTFRLIVLPQAARRILPVYRGEFISLVKMTSIVGYIGVQDLTKASDIIRSRTFEAFFPLLMVAAIYFLIIWVLGWALDYAERRLARPAR